MPLDEYERYATQIRVEQLGHERQEKLSSCKAAIVGVGALGSTISQLLVRAGVGKILLVDGDRAERGNLHRQILYTEEDSDKARPKIDAALERLRAANSSVDIEGFNGRLVPDNARKLLAGADVVVDGTDNLLTRFLINEVCVELKLPWVYGGIAGVRGMVMPIIPGEGPCLRCIFFDEVPENETPVAVSTGVFGPTPAVVGALQAAQAIRILVDDVTKPVQLLSVNVWTGETDSLPVKRSPACAICGR